MYFLQIPLEGLLRLLAGQRVIIEQRRAAGSNEELVSGLKRTGMLNSYVLRSPHTYVDG
jgi:hypothetical protein